MSISPTRSSLGSFERRKRRVVVVLGGNALVRPGDRPSMEGQLRRAREALEQLAPLLDDDTQLLISHGNGPQVGHILTRVEQALGKAYALPLEVCVAESEGELGYVLEQALANVLTAQGRRRSSAVLLSQVVVDAADPALSHPTKPIGVFYSEQEAVELRRRGFAMTEDAGRGWRRVVPSPRPVEVLGVDVIRTLLDAGTIVIAAGGGGIPVVRSGSQLAGLEAVIDKDLTGALLADRLAADQFVILTDVPYAYRDYRQPSQTPIGRIDDASLQQLFDDGHFAAGSMGPKVEAALQFVRGGAGRCAIICNPESLGAALVGDAGTHVVRTNEALNAAAFASAKGKADGAENSSSTGKSNVAVASDAAEGWDGSVESAESLEPGESNEQAESAKSAESAESAGARGAASRPSSQFN
ncbi:MAG TPA: carbamate kinase, partial [Pirellulaceae bacterium]|nr:carbamate kinase [Pirellulaceae bacterium]